MTRAAAVIDYLGLSDGHVPGNIRVRLRRVLFRADGTVVDDGTRSQERQTNCHSLVLSAGDDIEQQIGQSFDGAGSLSSEGYEYPDTTVIHHVAAHEWHPDVLASRRAQMLVNGPSPRIRLRALGFDLLGAGQIALGLSKITVSPKRVVTTQKANLVLHPGDDIGLLFDVLDAVADEIGYMPPSKEDRQLVAHVSTALWTPETLTARERAWREMPDFSARVRALEFRSRLAGLQVWNNIPAREPAMRSIN